MRASQRTTYISMIFATTNFNAYDAPFSYTLYEAGLRTKDILTTRSAFRAQGT